MAEGKALIVGVDGGGTKTEAWLEFVDFGGGPESERVRGVGVAGPSNLRVAGLARAVQTIESAIRAAFDAAGIPVCQVASACLAIAGADRQDTQAGLEASARDSALAQVVRICNDAEPILACLPQQSGVALIAGTGSFAYGRNAVGEAARAGGWGYRFGDEGSAYAIAVSGIAAAMRFADGRAPATELLPRLMERLQVRHARDLVGRLYASEFDRQAIAQLAPIVLEEARQGDVVAVEIRDRAAFELSRLVQAVQQRLQLPEDFCLALAGGVVLKSEEMRQGLIAKLAATGLRPQPTLVPSPVAGAVHLARLAFRDLAS